MGQIQLLLSASAFRTKFIEFWTKFKNEFVTNFIKENRWKWLVDGLKNTLLITLFSLLIGILLGVLVAIVRSTYDLSLIHI